MDKLIGDGTVFAFKKVFKSVFKGGFWSFGFRGFKRFDIFLQAADLFCQFLLFLVEFFVFLSLPAQLGPDRSIRHPRTQLAQNKPEENEKDDCHA